MNSSFKKLQGGFGLFFSSKLYMGDDHFLLVMNSPFSEEYRRFYFEEIEAVTARQTSARRTSIIACSLILFVLLTVGSLISFSVKELAVFVFIALSAMIPAVILFLNIVLGPTLECKIRTTASNELLPFVKRLRDFQKLLGNVGPIIEQSQGGALTLELLQGRFPSLEAREWQR